MSALYITGGRFQYPGDSPQEVRYVSGQCSGDGILTQDVWEADGVKLYPQFAGVGSVISTSALDTVDGIGCRKLIVFGLDQNFNEVTELVEMNGLTPVPTDTTWIRIFRTIVIDLGEADRVQGDCTCTVNGDLQSSILPHAQANDPVGTSLETHYTIPAGKTGFIPYWNVTQWNGEKQMGPPGQPNTQESHLQIRIGNDATLFNPPWHTLDVHHSGTVGSFRPFFIPRFLPEKTDIVVRARADSLVQLAASYEVILIDTPQPRITLP